MIKSEAGMEQVGVGWEGLGRVKSAKMSGWDWVGGLGREGGESAKM